MEGNNNNNKLLWSSSSALMAERNRLQNHQQQHQQYLLPDLSQSVMPSSNLEPRFLDPFTEVVPSWSYQDRFSHLSISPSASSTTTTEPTIGSYLFSLLPPDLSAKLFLEEGNNAETRTATTSLLTNDPAALRRRAMELESQVKLRDEIIQHVLASYHSLLCANNAYSSSSIGEYSEGLDSVSNGNARGRNLNGRKAVVQVVPDSFSYPTNNRCRFKKGCCSMDRGESARGSSSRRFPVRGCCSNGNHRGGGYNGSRHHCEEHCNGGNTTPVLDLSLIDNHEFRPPRNYTSLEEIRGRMLDAAMDQNGCTFLQNKIEEGDKEVIDLIFNELKGHIIRLMVGHYGNFLVQKIIEFCDKEQRSMILYTLIERPTVLLMVCCNSHGTRAVQKLLAYLTDPEEINHFILAVQPMVHVLITTPHSHHVIRHCFVNFATESNMYLINAVVENCVTIAMDSSGCCVLQQCIQCAHEEPKERLVNKIARNALLLSQDAYGNYVVQYVLKMKISHVNDELLAQLRGNFVSLSKQKFSSNVVQTCLNELSEEQSSNIIKELIEEPHALSVFQDPYGNFVMQTVLTVSEKVQGPLFHVLRNMITRNYSSLHSHPFGQKVLNCPALNKYQYKPRGR